jgi:hypothetical protein
MANAASSAATSRNTLLILSTLTPGIPSGCPKANQSDGTRCFPPNFPGEREGERETTYLPYHTYERYTLHTTLEKIPSLPLPLSLSPGFPVLKHASAAAEA